MGFDSVWTEDHLLLQDDGRYLATWEATTTLAAIAASTQRLDVGFMVVATIFRNPALLAKLAVTIDEISGGRLILGVGAGWSHFELNTFGYPADLLVTRFGEAFTILRSLISGKRVTYAGRYYSVKDAEILPKGPRVEGPGLMIGSKGNRMLQMTLPHVQGWNGHWSWPDVMNRPAGFGRLSKRVDNICHQVGRVPSDVWRSASVYVALLGATGHGIYRIPAGITPLSGPPERLAQEFADFAEAGADHLQLLLDPLNEASVEVVGEVLHHLR